MLKLRFKNNKLNAVWLVEPKVSIGRAASNDLVIDQGEIAEHHADILVKHENLTLVNVAGSKHLCVNGKEVAETAPLQRNDEVSLGSVVLEIVDPKAEIPVQQPREEKSVGGTGWALKPNHSALSNRVFPIKKETVIGRSNECDITLAAAHLSRRHVKLTVQDGLLFVKDLGSANGTYLNGERVTEARVKRGDELRFDTLSFGVIGPVEDMDKTSIRRVDPAVAATVAGAGKKPGGPKRPAKNVAVAARKEDAIMSDYPNGGADSNSAYAAEAAPKRKGLWLLGLLVVVAIGVAVAYQQGYLNQLLAQF